MAKEFQKGVSIGIQNEPEEVKKERVEDFSKEENKEIIRKNEEDMIQGLIKAADFVTEDTKRIEIARGGKVLFAFSIRPLTAEEYDKCRKKNTKYVRNRQLGMRMPDETDRVKYQSALIYEATVKEDRAKLWDNHKVWDALVAKGRPIARGLDVIEYTLKAGEKDKLIEEIDLLSGYDPAIEDVGSLEETAKN